MFRIHTINTGTAHLPLLGIADDSHLFRMAYEQKKHGLRLLRIVKLVLEENRLAKYGRDSASRGEVAPQLPPNNVPLDSTA
jgi:hypothetical protein